MYKKYIFVIDDYYGHGGHVKSFMEQIINIENDITNKVIVCSELGYIQKNIDKFKTITKKHLCLVPFNNIRRWQFSYTLYKIIKFELIENSILHVYSPECYFSALMAKSSFENVPIIHSVMGGPNPFPCLRSTDLYIAVSEEQKNYSIANSNSSYNCNIVIIKNRIGNINLNIKNELQEEHEKVVLVVTRLDVGLKLSLERIFSILEKLPDTYKIVIAGTGNMLDDYKERYKDYGNILFIGYSNNLMKYRKNTGVVLGMGRSILEFLLNGVPAILIGYKGIELLENIESVKYASSYNFAGREIICPVNLDVAVEKIMNHVDNNIVLDETISSFLQKEYDVNFFKKKYFHKIDTLNTKEISINHIFLEYIYWLRKRIYKSIKRKLDR